MDTDVEADSGADKEADMAAGRRESMTVNVGKK